MSRLTWVLWLSAVAFAHGQGIEILGDLPRKLMLSADALAARSSIEVRLGKSVYQGVPLMALLAEAGQERGAKLRGTQLTKVVLVKCEDAYEVAFSLAELDPEMREGAVILATRKDGQALDMQEGPVRLVVEKDRKMARSGRRVKSIEVIWLGGRN